MPWHVKALLGWLGRTSPAGRSLAAYERPTVEMKMIVMGFVVVGAERNAEIMTGSTMRGLQKAAFSSRVAPVAGELDTAPIGKPEAGT